MEALLWHRHSLVTSCTVLDPRLFQGHAFSANIIDGPEILRRLEACTQDDEVEFLLPTILGPDTRFRDSVNVFGYEFHIVLLECLQKAIVDH